MARTTAHATRAIELEGYRATPQNRERAQAALRGLDVYRNSKGEGGESDTDTLRDFLQDCLHWLAQRGFQEPETALREAVGQAVNDFPNEYTEEEN